MDSQWQTSVRCDPIFEVTGDVCRASRSGSGSRSAVFNTTVDTGVHQVHTYEACSLAAPPRPGTQAAGPCRGLVGGGRCWAFRRRDCRLQVSPSPLAWGSSEVVLGDAAPVPRFLACGELRCCGEAGACRLGKALVTQTARFQQAPPVGEFEWGRAKAPPVVVAVAVAVGRVTVCASCTAPLSPSPARPPCCPISLSLLASSIAAHRRPL